MDVQGTYLESAKSQRMRILNETIIGPFFIEGNLNADNYLAMLQDEIVPAIQNIARQNFNDILVPARWRHLTTVTSMLISE